MLASTKELQQQPSDCSYAIPFFIVLLSSQQALSMCGARSDIVPRYGDKVEFVTMDVSNWTAKSGDEDMDWHPGRPISSSIRSGEIFVLILTKQWIYCED